MKKFLQIFQSLHFNLSFSDALLYMPKFASTFKNLLSNKKKLFEVANTPVNENCSALRERSSTTRPTGIAEDVFVRVGKFHFPADFGEELTLRVGDEAITFKVGNTSKFSYNDAESINRNCVIDVACEEYSQEVLGFLAIPFDIKEKNSGSTTDHADVSLPEYERFYSEGDIRLLEKFLNDDPSSPLPPRKR
ncbi:hypothetical protein Tco_0503228 [Tanacetum coccineum]